MSVFKYSALNISGKKIQGYLKANNEEELFGLLRSRNYYVVDYKLKRAKTVKIKLKELYIFSRQMGYMMSAGFNVCESLDMLYSKLNGTIRKKIIVIKNSIENGKNLYESICECGDDFPIFYREMMKVSEETGRLEEVFKEVGDYYENLYIIKEKIKNILIYPSVILITTIFLIILLTIDIIPKFSDTLNGLGAKLPSITQSIMNTSLFLKNNSIVLIFMLFISILVIRKICNIDNVKKAIDKLKLKVPIFSKIYKKILEKNFISTLAILIKSGVGITRAMEVSAEVVHNSYAKEAILSSSIDIKNGMAMGESLKKLDIFSKFFIDMISMAEECGRFDEILKNTAGIYENEISDAVKRGVSLIEPVIIVLLAIFVGGVIISILLPIINIMNSIG